MDANIYIITVLISGMLICYGILKFMDFCDDINYAAFNSSQICILLYISTYIPYANIPIALFVLMYILRQYRDRM